MKTDRPYFRLNNRYINLEDVRKGKITGRTEFESTTLAFCRQWLNEQSPLSLRTSGSTGVPKTFLAERDQMLASVQNTNRFFNLAPGDTALVCLNTAYIAGKMMLARAITAGVNIIAQEPSINPLLELSDQVSFTALVPMQLEAIIDKALTLERLNACSSVIVGGAPLTAHLYSKLEQVNTVVYQTFGMTETMSHIALRELCPILKQEYVAFDNIQVGVNTDGNLTIQGKVTNHQQIDSRDQVKMTGPSSFIWLGRSDRVINSGGVKIYPEAIEEKIKKAFMGKKIWSKFFVHGTPDDQLGEAVILVMEGNDSDVGPLPPLDKVLTPYERPKKVIFVPSFTMTATGKIDRIQTMKLLS